MVHHPAAARGPVLLCEDVVGGDVHDLATTLLLHDRPHRPREQVVGAVVHVHYQVVVRDRLVQRVRWRGHRDRPRVVDQHVDPPEPLHRPVDHAPAVLGDARVRVERGRLDPVRVADLACSLVDVVADVADRDPRARRRRGVRKGDAESFGGARHERHLPVKKSHVSLRFAPAATYHGARCTRILRASTAPRMTGPADHRRPAPTGSSGRAPAGPPTSSRSGSGWACTTPPRDPACSRCVRSWSPSCRRRTCAQSSPSLFPDPA